MPDKPRPTLTEAELRIMRVLWSRKEATVTDVIDAVKKPRLARTTVQTVLTILERKGYASHRNDERTFVYHALLDQRAAQRHALGQMLSRFFDGSPEKLVVRLIDSDLVSKQDAQRIRQLLKKEAVER